MMMKPAGSAMSLRPQALILVTDTGGCMLAQPRASATRIKSRMPDDVQALLQQRKYDEALEVLLEAYGHKVLHMAVAMLRDTGRAEEVAQDVFLKIWRAFPSYDGRAAVSTWLYAIARNTCLSAVRSE